MKIIGLGLIHDFIKQYPDTKNWLENWIADARGSSWKTSHDIKARYSSCSFLPDNQVIFNVRGNNFRLEVLIVYKTGILIARWIGTHAEYSRRMKATRKL